MNRLCELFSVSESAYYAHLRTAKKPAKHTALAVEIKAIFDASRSSAGKRTIQSHLKEKGIFVGLYLIRKLMNKQELFSKQPQKWRNLSKGNSQVFENILSREFTPDSQTTVLCGDTTYIKINGIWCYLAVVINLLNRQVVGWKLSRYHDSELVKDALNHAMLNIERTERMLFHSDQGSIYGSEIFTDSVKKHGLTQSMSRRGNCWDNAPMERWFRSFKYEWMLKGGYSDFESAVNDVREYVMYYNHIRPHSYNQGLSPILAKTTYRRLLN
ncbi:IS3 family transposase [Basfia succiniciproducens]|uniref:IS3 family transposase n=1 Tax=Basfia succiniciproducens TaxID=653940 RepID=UPI003FCDCD4F